MHIMVWMDCGSPRSSKITVSIFQCHMSTNHGDGGDQGVAGVKTKVIKMIAITQVLGRNAEVSI